MRVVGLNFDQRNPYLCIFHKHVVFEAFFWHFCEHLLCDAKVFGAKLSAVDKVAFTGNFYQVFSFQRQSINLVSPTSFILLDFWMGRIKL